MIETLHRTKLAIIANAPTPYRTHFHARIVDEMPSVDLHSVFTHDVSNSPWQQSLDPRIKPICFGSGEGALEQSRLSRQRHEWRKGGEIIEWMKSQHVDAVIVGGYNDLGRLRLFYHARRTALPCFLWGDSNIRSDLARGTKRRLKSIFLSSLLSKLGGVMVCGRLGADYYKSYGANPSRIYYVPYEPDYRLFMGRDLDSSSSQSTLREFGIQPDRRRFVFSGRLVNAKSPELVVDAFTAIAAERPDWDLLMIGYGALRGDLASRVPVPLLNRVIWTGFINQTSKIADLYAASDILVLPSRYEPWGVVINEAAAAGLAIVSSNRVGAAYELVRDKFNGRIVATGSATAMREAMLECSAPDTIDQRKANSAVALSEWRNTADPIVGLKRALLDQKLLSEPARQ